MVSISSSTTSSEEETGELTANTTSSTNHYQHQDGSILFQPHRTIGLISASQPYSLSRDKSTSHIDTFMTMPLQERFVIYKCDSLKPVLVSNQLPGTKNKKNGSLSTKGEKMFHAFSDSSLGLTVTSHAYKGRWSASHISLYKRTKCIDTKEIITSNSWGIVQVLNLGRSKFPISSNDRDSDDDLGYDRTEKVENCVLMAIICAKHSLDHDNYSDDKVEMIGDNSDTDTDDDENDSPSSDSSDDEDDDNGKDITSGKKYHGEVVIVIASRYNISIQKRISLSSIPNFTPSISVHPHTYINKILIGGNKGQLVLLNIRSGKIIHNFKCFEKNGDKNGKITTLEQSPAVDTVAVGTECGKVHLVNIRMDIKLFSLYHNSASKARGSRKMQGITSLSFRTDAAALEHGIAPLAVGQMNGTISVWDLTPQSNDDSDNEDKSGATDDVRRSLLCQIENAHPGGVCQINYLPQEPLLLSSGFKSNNIIMHIFDNPNHTGRILRQRVGHISPPELIRYQFSSNGGILASMADGTDAASCQILSCGGKGDRSLRLFSTARSVLDRELSQGKGIGKKASSLGIDKSELYLSEIVGLATSDARSKDWGDIVTIHKNHSMAYVWSSRTKAQSGPVLRQEGWNVSAMKVQPPKTTHATAVTISSCGHFAVVGTKGGTIYKYNIQSGLPRGSFPRDATTTTQRKSQSSGNIFRTAKALDRDNKVQKVHVKEKDESVIRAENRMRLRSLEARHNDATVVGLAVDTMNKTLVSVGSDSKLILWSFVTHAPHPHSPIRLSSPATKLVHTRDSDLLAIALEDFSIIMFDCSSLSVVRKFGSSNSYNCHNGPITDLAFGPDGRKLFSSSLDGSLRVWDVPTSTCVDWMTFASAPTSLTLSSTGEFLATSHQGRLGISLWCDRSFFQTVHLGVQPPTKPFQMDEPATVAEDESIGNLSTAAIRTQFKNSNTNIKSQVDVDSNEDIDCTPKKHGLITLSGLPAAHWKNLFHLELVKERNKPTEAPKKPPSAPFFLQWRGGESIVPPNENETIEQSKKSEEEEWEAAWSDDEEGNDDKDNVNNSHNALEQSEKKRKSHKESQYILEDTMTDKKFGSKSHKKKKISHSRSDLAAILDQCSQSLNYEPVTEFLSKMGPSAIDVAFSSLCYGMHDLNEGLPLLHMASQWLLEACQSRKNFEVVNAYLHRFLYIHSSTIAGIDASWQEEKDQKPLDVMINSENDAIRKIRVDLLESIKQLRVSQHQATEGMKNKLQESLCLLRHFSRIL